MGADGTKMVTDQKGSYVTPDDALPAMIEFCPYCETDQTDHSRGVPRLRLGNGCYRTSELRGAE